MKGQKILTMKTKVIIFITVLVWWGCRYDKEQVGICTTSGVTYSATITGIINTYGCLNSSCHGGSTPASGFSLADYNGVKAKVTDGRLFGAISHASGFSPMPKNAGKMSECDIKKVKAWIDAGAPNN